MSVSPALQPTKQPNNQLQEYSAYPYFFNQLLDLGNWKIWSLATSTPVFKYSSTLSTQLHTCLHITHVYTLRMYTSTQVYNYLVRHVVKIPELLECDDVGLVDGWQLLLQPLQVLQDLLQLIS